jgi:hypothetical protein
MSFENPIDISPVCPSNVLAANDFFVIAPNAFADRVRDLA